MYHLTSPNVQCVCVWCPPQLHLLPPPAPSALSISVRPNTHSDAHFIYCLCSPFPTLPTGQYSSRPLEYTSSGKATPSRGIYEETAAAAAVTYFYRRRQESALVEAGHKLRLSLVATLSFADTAQLGARYTADEEETLCLRGRELSKQSKYDTCSTERTRHKLSRSSSRRANVNGPTITVSSESLL